MKYLATLFVCSFILGTLQAQTANWTFDKIEKTEIVKPLERRKIPSPEVDRSFFVTEEVSASKSKILGSFHKSVQGVVGNALQLDGNTSYIEVAPNLNISGDFSVGAWLALGAYPTHWCPVFDQNINAKKGFFLGIDAYGHAGVKAYIGGKLVEVQSEDKISLRNWTHIQGVYSPANGLTLYVNGKIVANAKTSGDFEPANTESILIGKSTIKQKPEGTVRPNGTQAVFMFLDGLIDELKVSDNALTSNEITEYFNKTKPQAAPLLATRFLPLTGSKSGKFGAVYSTLKFYEAWDKPWPAAQKPSDGRYAMADDNPSHSSLTNINWDAYELTEDTHTKIMLNGLTNQKAENLIGLTKSWSSPAPLKFATNALINKYDPTERAYQIQANGKTNSLNFSIEANAESPIDNPAFVVKNWGNRDISLNIDGKIVQRGKAFRYGFRDTEEGTDLVVFIEKKSAKPVKITLAVSK